MYAKFQRHFPNKNSYTLKDIFTCTYPQFFSHTFLFSGTYFRRDLLIEQLMREVVDLKERIQDLEGQVQANFELISSLRQQLEQKTREIEDYKEVAEQATSVSL